jgi:glycosyltransferase involved in cell wall biosynthesis
MNEVNPADIAALRNSGRFDEQWYLEQYRDVKLLGMSAAEHYLWVGAKLGRLPKAPPRVSVVIPTRNSGKYIKESIDSILNQTFSDFEILIIDDNSSDDTRAILGEYQDCRLTVLNGPGRGLAAALNCGMRQSKGEFIARMDADDIAHNTRLQKQVEYLDANPQLGVCGTLFQEFMGGDALHDHMENVRYADLLDGCYVGHPTAMLRRALFAEHDLFYNESLQFSEDYDLWSRAIRITEIGNVRENLLQYRRHGESASGSNVVAMTGLDVDVKVGMIDHLVGGVSLEQKDYLKKIFGNESVPEERRQSLVIDIADSIKYPELCSGLELISLFHRLKAFDDAFIDKVTRRELQNLPIFVISFNHLTHLKSIVEFFQREGISNVAIIDNNSTYPPLVDYLKTVPYKVYRMSRNYGHMVLFDNPLFKEIVDNKYFALTDPDILPEAACPKEYFTVFMKILLQRPMKNRRPTSTL